MIQSYLRFYKKFWDFNDRDNRHQFWQAMLIHFVVMLSVLFIFPKFDESNDSTLSFLFFMVAIIVLLLPFHAAVHRRMKDIGAHSKILRFFNGIFFVLSVIVFVICILYLFTDAYKINDKYLLPIIFGLWMIKVIFSLCYCTLPTDKYKR